MIKQRPVTEHSQQQGATTQAHRRRGMYAMRWQAMVRLMILAFVVAVPIHLGAAPAPAPIVRYDTKIDGLTMSGPFTLILRVRDFAPGAWTTVHIHGGPVLVTMLEGTLTLRINGADQTFQKGGSWVELPGSEHAHAVGNTGTVMASALSTTLLPAGAQETTTVESGGMQPGPTVKYEARLSGLSIDGAFTEHQRVVDFAPGAKTPVHVHGGSRFVLVLGGAMTLRINGVEQVYTAGQSFLEPQGIAHVVSNNGPAPASQVSLTLLPNGAVEMTNLGGTGGPSFFLRRLGDG